MKVNILGRGLIPFIGTLAPVYKVDLGRKEIASICNFKHLRVYEVSSGKLITKSNVNRFFDTDTNIPVNNGVVKPVVVEKKVEPIVETPTIIEEVVPQVVETIEPVIEPTDDDVLSNQVIIEEPDSEETNSEEEVVGEIEETTESNNEENKSNTFKKNKKKNRH